MRYIPLILFALLIPLGIVIALMSPFWGGASLGAVFPVVGISDLVQTRHAVLKNYPVSARLRFLL